MSFIKTRLLVLFMMIFAIYSESRTKPVMQSLFAMLKEHLKGSEYQRNRTRVRLVDGSLSVCCKREASASSVVDPTQ